MKRTARRSFLKQGLGSLAAVGAAAAGAGPALGSPRPAEPSDNVEAPRNFQLGLVTYNLARHWDIDTIIKNCREGDFKAVELRSTHRHGVEPTISKAKRAEVRKRFEGSGVRLFSLGSACEFESPDPAVVRQNIELTRKFCELAHDVGAVGVKVRPNGFPPGVPHEKTLEQIGRALKKCGDLAQSYNVEVWLEVHGRGTRYPKNIRCIMEVADHPAVGICWNSNATDVVAGSVRPSFELIGRWLRSCHINELWKREYPWRELFALFRSVGYNRYTYAEIPESCEPIRLMHYYRRLWEYQTAA